MTDADTTPTADTPPADTTPNPDTSTAGTASAATPAAPTAVPVSPAKRRPLFPTILWGAMMLAVAAYFAARELVPGGLDLTTWLLTAVVGIGLLLVVAGIAAASRRAG
ncbi:hypothetical protein [Cryobacterium sp. AP23]